MQLVPACAESQARESAGKQDGEALDVTCTVLPTTQHAFRALTSDSGFDACEMSLAFFATLTSQGTAPFVALPVFLSRSFRYGNLFVRSDSELEDLTELRGRRVGLPEYGMTMGVWIRGLLADFHGILAHDIEWVTTRQPVLTDVPNDVAARGISVSRLRADSLWDALEEGNVDAAIGRPPEARHRSPFRRLLGDYAQYDLEYYRSTGIFPIMHTLVVRRTRYEEEPGVVQRLFTAFCESKRVAMDNICDSLGTLPVAVPQLSSYIEDTISTFGKNWWPYGVDANRPCLETVLRYGYEQGVLAEPMTVEHLFCPESLDLVDEYSPCAW